MQMIMRRATSADSAATADLYLRARRAASTDEAIPPLVHHDDQVIQWVTHVVIPTLECWLAEDGSGRLVGMLVRQADWIEQLYVDPDLTGAGIGSELITVAKRERWL